MHAFLIDRERWARKSGVSERSYRNGDELALRPERVVDRCAARWTEVERDPCPFITDAHELVARACDDNRFSWEPSLSTKHASGAALACQAMANRHPNGFSRDLGLELTTATGSETIRHVRGVELVTPNVGANRPAEADGVSPDCDDSTSGAGRAYDGCRSGSG